MPVVAGSPEQDGIVEGDRRHGVEIRQSRNPILRRESGEGRILDAIAAGNQADGIDTPGAKKGAMTAISTCGVSGRECGRVRTLFFLILLATGQRWNQLPSLLNSKLCHNQTPMHDLQIHK